MGTNKLKNKACKKFRAAKRKVIEERRVNPRIEEHFHNCHKISNGVPVHPVHRPKNAFLHPNDKAAVTPQKVIKSGYDFRLTVANVRSG
ncbi:hypothetical protein GNI_136170 [Gregarina niphandrodes]|uniref:Uncharacterized protein n=1 Tax=Gregarina niphandrodes TaxID=110365 RepID=A0A023B0U3_GRENI|nr:hypothetical protein GNI_136170 [Gregarina niphandrodes]EZG45944.1 hypothetical protein GNI_136170 [Gregarina niphandrodes]|eukprot:XP_011132412.1 hypothetical protein GNI_136170 [Gregarina niphandrodes]